MNARRPLPSAVRNLRPTRTARFELMPGVVLYDHEADPDLPVLPDLVALALSVLLRSVDVPGSVSRPHTCDKVSTTFVARISAGVGAGA